MRLAPASSIILLVLASAGSPGSRASSQDEHPPAGCDFALEKGILEEAIAAVKAVDLPGARAKAGEAILALLARPECESDAAWQSLVHTAGRVAWDAQDPAAARTAWEKLLEVRSRTLPDDHPALQAARGNLAAAIRAVGDLQGARVLEEKVLEVRARTLPDDHPDLQTARGNLAATIKQLGDLAGARALEEKVLEVRSRTVPDDHPYLQLARTNLAITLERLGEVAEARALFEKVLQIRTRTLPEDHPDLQIARLHLAVAMKDVGDLHGARALEEKVLEVRSRTLPADHPYLQEARGNLAVTVKALGDLPGARALEEKALEVLSRTLPDDHPVLQIARTNLAVTYVELGDFPRARAIQEKVLEVRSLGLPEDHADLQIARGNLASTLQAMGDFEGARGLEEKVLEVFSRTLPEDHPDLQSARGNLAVTLGILGDLAGARALEETVLESLSRTRGENDPSLRTAQGNLAQTIAAIRWSESRAEGRESRPDEAAETERLEFTRLAGLFTRALARSARRAVLTVSGREAEERCAGWMPDFGRALSFAAGLGVFAGDPGLVRESFILSEESRGAALASACLARRALPDPRHAEMRARMRAASDELAHLSRNGAGADELDRARTRREEAERDLAAIAGELSDGEGSFDPDELSTSLSAREAVVGYRRYGRWSHEPAAGVRPKGTAALCAFVLRSGSRLECVELGPIAPVERAVSALRQAIGVGSGRGIGTETVGPADDEAVAAAGGTVRRMIFDPLLPALEGADRIVVALDDVLFLVPLDALPCEEATADTAAAGRTLLGDRWRIETRCTLSELLQQEAAPPGDEALVALGGAAFQSAPLGASAEDSADHDEPTAGSTKVASLLRGGAWEKGFQPLASTGPEARGIAKLYAEAFDEERPAHVLEERKASRESLAELAPGARFLHIATHGWFAPDSVQSLADPEPLDRWMGFGARMSGEERAKGMSPMLLCGIALAGASLGEDELARAPGLLTAEEISALDLSGCELAVLSACDTNVGERRAGQGVASLQKALHMAGARSVVTSLWKVPDEATRELMIDFYRRLWVEKKPKCQALWESKMRLRAEKDESGRPLYTTRDWAAWVLTGDPR